MRPLALALAAASLSAGCGGARVLTRTSTSGTLALEGRRDWARDAAHRQMTSHCEGPYTILHDGPEPAGNATSEFRVHYVCGEVPGLPTSSYQRPSLLLEGIPNTTRWSLD